MLSISLSHEDNYKFNHLTDDDKNSILEALQKCLKYMLNDKKIDPNCGFGQRRRLFRCINDNRFWNNQQQAADFYHLNQSIVNGLLHKKIKPKNTDLEFEFV